MIRERVRIYCIAQCASPPILRFLLLVGNEQPNPYFLSAVYMHIVCYITIDHLSSLSQSTKAKISSRKRDVWHDQDRSSEPRSQQGRGRWRRWGKDLYGVILYMRSCKSKIDAFWVFLSPMSLTFNLFQEEEDPLNSSLTPMDWLPRLNAKAGMVEVNIDLSF